MNCPNCQKEIQQDWVYCYFCGIKLRESNIDESYSRILAMYEFEQERRQLLESKSATYIGLTSVMVTILLVVGNLLFSSSAISHISKVYVYYLLLALYICAVAGFTFSAVFAFRAYHTGSVFTYHTTLTDLLNTILGKLVGTEVYKMVDPEKVLCLVTTSPENAKTELLKTYSRVWKKNYDLNNLKSDRILICYALSSMSLITIVLTTVIVLIIEI